MHVPSAAYVAHRPQFLSARTTVPKSSKVPKYMMASEHAAQCSVVFFQGLD